VTPRLIPGAAILAASCNLWRVFQHPANDFEKVERYQAEALVFKQCPVEAIVGIGCYNEKASEALKLALEKRGLDLKLTIQPGWYF